MGLDIHRISDREALAAALVACTHTHPTFGQQGLDSVEGPFQQDILPEAEAGAEAAPGAELDLVGRNTDRYQGAVHR